VSPLSTNGDGELNIFLNDASSRSRFAKEEPIIKNRTDLANIDIVQVTRITETLALQIKRRQTNSPNINLYYLFQREKTLSIDL